jgi:diaminopimelate epimerase
LSPRHPLAGRTIARMNGAGNAILVLDLRGSPVRATPEDARAIHRAPGLSYDQMMVLRNPETAGTAADVLIYNNDGTLAGACGNGTRCVADLLCRELGAAAVKIETEAGVIRCERLGPWSYRVDMGTPRLEWEAIPLRHAVPDARRVSLWPDADAPAGLGPASVVNMGNPHAVFFVPDLESINAADLGPSIEVDPMFPEKANVTFAEVLARDDVRARVWERGVGLTLACGSAACAIGLMERKGTVRLPGGDLIIEWRASDDHVLMTGPVEYEGAFLLDEALFEAATP